MFDEGFIKQLPVDKWDSAKKICSHFFDFYGKHGASASEKIYHEYLKAYIFLKLFIQKNELDFPLMELSENPSRNIEVIANMFSNLNDMSNAVIKKRTAKEILESAEFEYASLLGTGFAYVFTDGDLEKIQTLINEIRELINKSKIFEEDHKTRLLNRLEKLQQELHKRMSNLDKFWGLVGDAGVVLGKFGKDAKPFVDRIQEIAQIVWGVQARSEELQSGLQMPLLMPKKDEETDKGEK
ncbi:MAG: hypothetical protein ABSE89_01005 [Sedimentisphaerales bacterium]